MYFVVMLAFKMLIYALVNSAFSGIAGLKLHLFIQPLGKTGMTNLLFSHPHEVVVVWRCSPYALFCSATTRSP